MLALIPRTTDDFAWFCPATSSEATNFLNISGGAVNGRSHPLEISGCGYKTCNAASDMTRLLDSCYQSCHFCLRLLYWLPVVFVLAILIWAYYVYVYTLNLSGNFSKPIIVTVFFLLIGHVILFLHLSSYFRTIFTKHKPIPQEFVLSDDQLDAMDEMVDIQPLLSEMTSNMTIHQATRTNGIRYCTQCDSIKPDRSHHCSTCGRCILKMDHHCPWVNNCVGYSNYKYFYLFLMYTLILGIWFCLTSLYDIIQLWTGGLQGDAATVANKFNVTFCVIIVGIFCLSTSTLFFYHTYLIVVNKTTIESMAPPYTHRGPVSGLYNLGVRNNIKSVFGSNILLALLPVHTSEGNGALFPIKGQSSHVEYRMNRLAHHSQNEEGATINGQLSAHNFTGSESESEIEIYAVDDKRTETHPLTQSHD